MEGWLSSLSDAAGWMLKASVQASVLIIIVLAVQGIFRERLSPKWRFALWYLVLARLLLPVLPQSPLSIFNFAPSPKAPAEKVAVAPANPPSNLQVPVPLVFPTENVSPTPEPPLSPAPVERHVRPQPTTKRLPVGQILGFVWLAGILVLTTRVAIALKNMVRRLRSSRPIDDPAILKVLDESKERIGVKKEIRVFESTEIQSPCLIGVLKPRLQIPSALLQGFTEQELRLIFLHELAHVKRHDILINWLSTAAQILHWFNPLVWLAFSRMRAHRELACDAMALTAAGEQEREAYGGTIIRLVEQFSSSTPVAGSLGILEDRHQIKERILMIARFKIASRWSLLALPLLLVIGLFCLTDAQVTPLAIAPQQAPIDPNPKMIVKVVNEMDEPIANATVQGNYFTADDLEGHDVVTDEQGIARVPQPKNPDEPINGMNLWVVSSNHVPKVVRWNRYNIPVEYTFKLASGKKLSGLVVDQKGQPVPGVQLKISGPGLTGDRDEEIQFHSRLNKIITGANGRWTCNFIPADFKDLRFILTHSNYAVTEKTFELPKAFSEENRVELARANTLLGRVLSDSGEPIADARVREVHNFSWRKAETKTDKNGNFILGGLRLGSALIVVQAEGRSPEGQTIDVAGDVSGLEFQLKKGNRFAGRVIDQAGQPVAGVEVGTASDNQGLTKVEFKTKTDAQGHFEWNAAPEETLLYYVRGKGIRFAHGLQLAPGEHEIKVVREERDHILIRGKVLDAKSGEPIPQFHVTVGESFDVGGDFHTSWTSLGTDGHNGGFKLPIGKPSPFPRFVLSVDAPGYFPANSTNLTIAAGDQNLEFRLLKGVPLAGVILLPDGRPVAGAPVFLCTAQGGPYMDKPGEVHEDIGPSNTSTAADGSFRLDPKTDQHSVVIVNTDGYLEIPIAAFERTNRFVLQPYGRVEGTVYLEGKPVAGTTVTVGSMHYRYEMPGTPKRDFPLINIFLKATTDENGKFAVEKVPPGDRKIYQVLSFRNGKPGPIPTTHQTYIAVKAGETSQVNLGLGGKKVFGRITLKNAPAGFDWIGDVQRLEPKPPTPNRPLETDFPDRKEFIAAMQKWGQAERVFWQSDEGHEFERTHRTYCAVFDENGRFVVNDVLPGPYTFAVRLTSEPPEGALGPSRMSFRGSEIASAFVNVIVPSGDSDSPVDLGEIVLEARDPQKRRFPASNPTVKAE